MNHQVQHHGDIRTTRRVRCQAVTLHEQRVGEVRQCCAHGAVEALHMPHLQHDAGGRRGLDQRIRLVQRHRDRLLHEQVLAGAKDRHADLVMRHRRHHAAHGVARRHQRLERRMRLHAQLTGDHRRTLGIRVVETGERHVRHVPQYADVVIAQSTCPCHTDARAQNPMPRSLSSMNVRNAVTSGNGCSSARARDMACVTFSSERNTSR